jgi:hypothetical protein
VAGNRFVASGGRWTLLAVCWLALTGFAASPAAAQELNKAGLVVRFDDSRTETACVPFAEERINGYELLIRSGLAVTTEAQGMGALVCAIEATGCPANDCLCQCRGGECVYWSYWRQVESDWRYSAGGAAVSPITAGMVDGWSWGPSNLNAAAPPPALTFAEICGEAAVGTTAVPEPAASAEAEAINWLPYLIFALIVAALSGRLILTRRKS